MTSAITICFDVILICHVHHSLRFASRYIFQCFDSKRNQKHVLSSISTHKNLFFASHHLCQVLKSSPPLVNDLVESISWTDSPDDDLITPRCKSLISLICKCIHRHTELLTALAHIIV